MSTSAVLLLCALAFAFGAPYPPKRLAGPVEEFPIHRMLDPKTVLTQERSSSHFIWLDTSLPGSVYSTIVPVDGPSAFIFTFASPLFDKLTLKLLDPTGKDIDLSSIRQDGNVPIGTTTLVPVSTYNVSNSIRGYYTLSVHLNGLTKEEADRVSDSPFPNAILTVLNNDFLEIQSHLPTYLIDVGDTIGVVSTLVNLQPGANQDDIHVTRAQMGVITPDGEDIEVDMLSAAGDDSYGAIITATVPGDYLIQARLEGWISGSSGSAAVPFVRTTEHVVGVSAAAIALLGTGSLRSDDPTHAWVDLDIKQFYPSILTGAEPKQAPQLTFRAYTEVWGVEVATGNPKAACWIGGVVDVNGGVASLQLDLRWLQRAGVRGPLFLKNSYLTDMETSFPVADFDGQIVLKNSALPSLKISESLLNMPIVREMREGVKPQFNRSGVSAAAPSLFLLPGYCASLNPFPPAHFTDGAYFIEKGNFGHDEYAQKVMNFVNTFNPESFSFIGHSQGGFVALHIYNYYFTPLENAKGDRLIQTIGTPWQGCSAAGDSAALGKIFGIGCGANNDLTRDGALNWLSGISMENRKVVHSYTTTYKQGNLFGDWCSLPMNLILQWPNDGTTELKYAKLDGGFYEGNTEKQCHTTGMAYVVQTSDESRNKLMNSLAAR
jgi:hypothetical protein